MKEFFLLYITTTWPFLILLLIALIGKIFKIKPIKDSIRF